MDVFDLVLISQFLDFIGNKFEHFLEQLALVYFAFPTEIDQLAVESVTASAPSVFVEQTFLIATEGHVITAQFLQFENNRLHQSRQRDGVVNARLRIANPKFNGVEKRMQPDVPPNLLRIIDAIRGDQQFPDSLRIR